MFFILTPNHFNSYKKINHFYIQKEREREIEEKTHLARRRKTFPQHNT